MTEFLTEVHRLKRTKKNYEQKMYYYKKKYEDFKRKRNIVSIEIKQMESGE